MHRNIYYFNSNTIHKSNFKDKSHSNITLAIQCDYSMLYILMKVLRF